VDPCVHEQLRPLPTNCAVTVSSSSSSPYLRIPTTKKVKDVEFQGFFFFLGSFEHFYGRRRDDHSLVLLVLLLSEVFWEMAAEHIRSGQSFNRPRV
jgi:hypothetical protein